MSLNAIATPAARDPVTQRGPEPERSVADGEHWRSHAAALAVPEQVGPRLRRLAVPIGERDQLFGAVGTHADHHQQADVVLLQADLEVDPVDPQALRGPYAAGSDVRID
jgi:hypothetical protein